MYNTCTASTLGNWDVMNHTARLFLLWALVIAVAYSDAGECIPCFRTVSLPYSLSFSPITVTDEAVCICQPSQNDGIAEEMNLRLLVESCRSCQPRCQWIYPNQTAISKCIPLQDELCGSKSKQNSALRTGSTKKLAKSKPRVEDSNQGSKKLTANITAITSVDCSDRTVTMNMEVDHDNQKQTIWSTLMSPGGPTVTLCQNKRVDDVELYEGLKVQTQYFGADLQVTLNGTIKDGVSCKSFLGEELYHAHCPQNQLMYSKEKSVPGRPSA
eukprot:gb/GECG01006141.1/.p1 GENE.gb/GECG01006141.1/~~gb/GECG01006141.1/.p1  ORF type:complete len:271 (+),score=25.56 gb/GECG01006141.1/:1-813(+)